MSPKGSKSAFIFQLSSEILLIGMHILAGFNKDFRDLQLSFKRNTFEISKLLCCAFFQIQKKSLWNPGWAQVHHHGAKMGFRKPREPEFVVARSCARPVAGASVGRCLGS